MNNIKNIIFDLGGVVVDLEIKAALKEFGALMIKPVTSEEAAIQYLRPLMHAMDRGEMDGQTFTGIIKQQCRDGVTDQEIIDAFNRIIRLPKHRLEWLRQLRKKYRVFLLSNIGDIHWEETQRQATACGIDFMDCFDEVFLSYQLRMAKPEPGIYEHLIRETGIEPQETLYIDDLPDNIAIGQRFGLQTFQLPCNKLDEEISKLFPEIL